MSDAYRIRQGHGLGDAVALTAVLLHLRHYDPDCRIELDVFAGREALYDGLVDDVRGEPWPEGRPTHVADWPLPDKSYRDCPSTYVERFLIERLGLGPIPELCAYSVAVRDRERQRVRDWLESVPVGAGTKRALFQPAGASRKDKKDLTPGEAAAIAAALSEGGYQVLAWDPGDEIGLAAAGLATPVPDGAPLFRLVGTDCRPRWRRPIDVGTLAGLLAEIDLFVGVDSGPLHLAAAVGAPSIGLWPRQSPLHCICPVDSMLHLVRDESAYIHPPVADGLAYFRAHYRHERVDDFAAGVASACASLNPEP